MTLRQRLWFWTQMAIWPLIRDTTCVYCIFLRGVFLGWGSALLVYILWRMSYGP